MAKKGFGFKPKENGGVIRGPGTGTSDSIATEMQPGTYIMPADSTRTIGDEALKKMADAKVPVRVSNGEFEFTPEQVQSIGAAVLTALRDATHKPVDKPAGQPKGFFGGGMIGDGLSTKSRGDGPFGEISFSDGLYMPRSSLDEEEEALEKEIRWRALEKKRKELYSGSNRSGMGFGSSYANGGTIQPRGFQPFKEGGLVQKAMGLFSSRKQQVDDVVNKATGSQQAAPAPAPAPKPQANNPKFDEKRVTANNAAGISFADGGMVSGGEFVNPLAGVGDYWSKSNAEFEAQGPSIPQRVWRSINPVTGFGSAVGAMHDGASKGSAVDMSIAALQAIPVFAAMRPVKTAIGAVPAAMAPSAAGTAAGAAKNVAAGVVADEAQEGNYSNGFANGGQVEIEQDGSPVHMKSLKPLDSNQIVGRTQTAGPGKKEYNEQYGFGPGTGRGAAPFDFRTGKKNEGYRHGFKGNPTRRQGLAGGGLVRDDKLAASGMMSSDGTFIPEYQSGKNRMDMYGSTMRGRTGLANGGPVPARGFQPQRFSKGGKVEEEEPGIYPYNHPAAGANVYGGTASDIKDMAKGAASFAGDVVSAGFPRTSTYAKGAAQEVADGYEQGGVGAALGKTARGLAGAPIALADDIMGSAARVIDPYAQVLKTAFTGDATPINKPPAKPDADKSSPPARTPQYATLASVEGTQNRNQAPQAKGFDPEQAAQHFDRTKMTNAQVAEENPEGRVKVTKNANGTTEFSGNNVRGAVSYTDASGNALPGGGINGKGFATVEVAPAGSNVATGPNGSYAYATSGSGTRTPEKVQQDIAQSKLQTADRAKQLGVDVNGMTTAQAEQYMAHVQAARENARSAQAIAGGSKGAWENFNDMRSHENIAYRNAGVTAKSLLSGGKNFGGNNSAAVNSALNAQKAIIDSVAKRAAGEPSLAENQRQFDAQQGLAVRQQDAGERSAELAAREQARQTQRKEGMEDQTFATASENARLELAAAQRKAAAFDAYAKATPEARAQVAAQFPDLFGREKNAQENLSNNFMRRKVAVLDEQGRPTGAEREEIVDLRTSRVVNTDGGQNKPLPAPKDVASRVIGQTYISPKGQAVIWNGEGWIPA